MDYEIFEFKDDVYTFSIDLNMSGSAVWSSIVWNNNGSTLFTHNYINPTINKTNK